jgi:competence protein ComEA
MTKVRSATINPLVLSLVLGMGVGVAPALLAQQKSTGSNSATAWETLEGCRLATNFSAAVDGDSFQVRHQGRDYIFRLYFVDAPERDVTLKDRIQDQAVYFGISPQDIPRAGQSASQFTRDLLSKSEFTVITRWQNALGRSSLARFYAVVLVQNRNLAEELVAAGLARIYGPRANWPDGPRSTTFRNKLQNLEMTAREKKLGVWDETKYPRRTNALALTNLVFTNASVVLPGPLDLNHASYEELLALPGVGPVLAERIMAGRPFHSVTNLDQVEGIGPEKLKQLAPLVRVAPATP